MEKFLSYLQLLLRAGKYRDMLIILNSGSKTFNLAGLIHSHVIITTKEADGNL